MAYQEPLRFDQSPEGFLQGSIMENPSFGFSATHNTPCGKCGFCPGPNSGGTLKKRSSPCYPSSSSDLSDYNSDYDHYQPNPKKLLLDTSPDSTPTPNALPPLVPAPECSVSKQTPSRRDLRRCVSDPYEYPVATVDAVLGSTDSDAALPHHTALGRSVSDLNPPAAATTFSGSCSGKMVVHDEGFNKDDDDVEELEDDGSFLSVENMGEFVKIHLKCECGKACELVVAGGNCYYKIM